MWEVSECIGTGGGKGGEEPGLDGMNGSRDGEALHRARMGSVDGTAG